MVLTKLRVNLGLPIATMAGNDPTNNRFQCSKASIRSCEELDRSHLHPAHRGGPEVGTGTGPYAGCRSTQCCVAVWSR